MSDSSFVHVYDLSIEFLFFGYGWSYESASCVDKWNTVHYMYIIRVLLKGGKKQNECDEVNLLTFFTEPQISSVIWTWCSRPRPWKRVTLCDPSRTLWPSWDWGPPWICARRSCPSCWNWVRWANWSSMTTTSRITCPAWWVWPPPAVPRCQRP